MTDNIYKALQAMQTHFGADIFNDSRRFINGLNDVVSADAKKVKNLLRIAICDLNAYARLEKATDESKIYIVKHLEREMHEDYMISEDIAIDVIKCISTFMGITAQTKVPNNNTSHTLEDNANDAKPITPPQSAFSAFLPSSVKPTPIQRLSVPPTAIISAMMQTSQGSKGLYNTQQNSIGVNVSSSSVNNSSSSLKIGDKIRFGTYEWYVLDIQWQKALLITDKLIGTSKFHNNETGNTWAGSTLRRYLNFSFYDTFSKSQKSRIVQASVKNAKNPWFGTDSGNDTTDNVFLLSIEEILKYFGESNLMHNRLGNIGHISDHHNGGRVAKDMIGMPGWWWLRSAGSNNRVAFISQEGALYIYGGSVFSNGGIRPSLWMKL